MKIKRLLILLFALLTTNVFSQIDFEKPLHGFYSEKPAINWQYSLISGNGTMGILVPGEVKSEKITVNHSLLYLPYEVSGKYVNQGAHLEEIREMLLKGDYRSATNFINTIKNEADYRDKRDRYIPGFNIKIDQDVDSVSHYQRSVNYESGEAIVDWENEKGVYQRRAFVSRADSIVVIQIKGSGKVSARISFESLDVNNSKELAYVAEGFDEIGPNTQGNSLTFTADYRYRSEYTPFDGYQGVGKVINKGGELKNNRGVMQVTGADEIIVIVKLIPVENLQDNNIVKLKSFVESKGADYESLLNAHKQIHGKLYNRVKLDLNADEEERALSTDKLIEKSRKSEQVPLAMIEKAFNAGRYNIISCTGTNPPNLIGLWSGEWLSPWSGSFTTNGNMPTSLAFLLQGNTPELMQGLFNWNELRMEGFRKNAKDLYNCRGIHIPAQLTVSPLETDFTPLYPHSYWVGSAGWVSNFYYDYYQYTGDKEFLKDMGYPYMKEAALFYEDFLSIEKNGELVFAPSYSPENAPDSWPKNPAASINATMEVMIARQLLENCIHAAELLNVDNDKVAQWTTLLNKMPQYQVSEIGTLREWLWPGLKESNNHRHASHLYALYHNSPDEFKVDSLKEAARQTIRKRLTFNKTKGGGVMAFGVSNLGWAAAHIGDAELVAEAIDWQAKHYWSTGMASFHDFENLFNMDISGGFPYMIAQCIAYSEPGLISLLPALPVDWQKGSVEGLKLRGNVLLKSLTWDGTKITGVLYSENSQDVKLKTSDDEKIITLKANKEVKFKF